MNIRLSWLAGTLLVMGLALITFALIPASAQGNCERKCELSGGRLHCWWECGAATAYPTPRPQGTIAPPTPTRTPAPTATPCVPGSANCTRQPCLIPPNLGGGGIQQPQCNNGWGSSLSVQAQIPIMNITR